MHTERVEQREFRMWFAIDCRSATKEDDSLPSIVKITLQIDSPYNSMSSKQGDQNDKILKKLTAIETKHYLDERNIHVSSIWISNELKTTSQQIG